MKPIKQVFLSGMLVAALMAVAPSVRAQVQTTGTPDSPSPTTTISGEQLPAPPGQFGGRIKESALDSTPSWPPRVVPPKGAPNILLIMTDDQGYGVSVTFGGVIPTPALGIKQKPIEGVSMAYTFDRANANAPSKRDTQYFEIGGNRAIYHNNWIAATTPPSPPWVMGTAKMPDVVNGYQWELYNIAEDYSENNDLAAKQPEKLKELQALFLTEATKYQVFPLDNSAFTRLVTPKPSATAGRTVFTYSGENAGIPVANAPSILDKDSAWIPERRSTTPTTCRSASPEQSTS